MAVVAAVAGLASINSGSSSPCEEGDSTALDSTASESPADAESVDAGSCDDIDLAAADPGTSAEPADQTTSTTSEPHHAVGAHVVSVPAEPASTDPTSTTLGPDDADPTAGSTDSTADTTDPAPSDTSSADPAPSSDTTPADPDPDPPSGNPAPPSPNPRPGSYDDITAFGVFHGTSSHTHGDSLAGGRTPITTEALVSYNGLRAFVGLDAVEMAAIGQWAFANRLTNNGQAYEQDLLGVGLYYGMQGAKVGWIRDDAFDPQILADIQLAAREGRTDAVMAMVETVGHPGYADHLTQAGLVDAFVNTLKMEPHYGGWMHGRVHGDLAFSNGAGAAVATAHDLNHLTVLSHDQTEPFMNDTFDWPQWPALDVPEPDVIDYFQSMVVLSDPLGDTQL